MNDQRPPASRPMPPRAHGLLGSFKHAYEGLVHTVVNQRNMKIHVVSALLVAMVGSGIVLDLATKATLIFCVLLVFFAEILNTALEALVDLHIDEFDERARITKDVAAAGVLVLAIGTVAIFAAVIVTHWPLILESGDRVLRQVVAGGPLVAIGGLLLWKARRAVWLDVLASVAGAVLILLLASWTSSAVMTGMTAGLFALCVVAARRRQLADQASAANPGSAVAGPGNT
ncbi:MAG: diacylglycerol kinase family protein [Myxococcales bacterium]